MLMIKLILTKIMVRLNYWKAKIPQALSYRGCSFEGSLLLLRQGARCDMSHLAFQRLLKIPDINSQLYKTILLTSVLFWTLLFPT